ncbi:MAG TPA: thioredoxin domain-containing protein [Gammaproteobacteria bacterium]|nr:thioredoxin domain-containing protein [Gammaproteobacteria bacterium]
MIKFFHLLLFISMLSVQSVRAENITMDHPSPYVRMHASDAVKWQKWDSSVLLRAQKENKLIMISSGYFACHWCHVMRRESFTDAEIAALLNSRYIPVKIDRELNSSLDAYLMGFLQRTQHRGGWPLNVFLTPEGYPLTGLVYLPPKRFKDVLFRLDTRWQADSAGLNKKAADAFEYAQNSGQESVYVSNDQLASALLNMLSQVTDDLQGGFGDGAKFPMPYLMMSLIGRYEKKPDKQLAEFIRLTLQQMATKGLHDVVGGGFFRYTVDQGWQLPHFEKMLYTNAAMIELYVKAYEVFNDRRWLIVAEETVDFVIREMQGQNGFYVSSLNAQDASGEEGGNYTWDKKELLSAIKKFNNQKIIDGTEYHAMPGSEKVLPVGLWAGQISEKNRRRLWQKRIENPPVKDDKLLLSWNAYLLSSMVNLIKVSDKKQTVNAARALYKNIKAQTGSDLLRNRQGHAQRYLEDYVFVANALYQWNKLQKSDVDRKLISSLVMRTLTLFADDNGWNMTDKPVIPMPASQKNIKDANLPSAEVVLVRLLYELKPGHSEVKKIIRRISQQVDVRVANNPLEYSSLIDFKLEYKLDL